MIYTIANVSVILMGQMCICLCHHLQQLQPEFLIYNE